MLPNTKERDRDQVVYRYRKQAFYDDEETQLTKKQRRQKLKDLKILMVDQLWVWFIPADLKLKSDTIVTCFPRRLCQRSTGDADLLDSILEVVSRPPQVSSPYDLITLIISKCANIFDRSSEHMDLQFKEFFESAIGRAVF